jgi:hypothetical protein
VCHFGSPQCPPWLDLEVQAVEDCTGLQTERVTPVLEEVVRPWRRNVNKPRPEAGAWISGWFDRAGWQSTNRQVGVLAPHEVLVGLMKIQKGDFSLQEGGAGGSVDEGGTTRRWD